MPRNATVSLGTMRTENVNARMGSVIILVALGWIGSDGVVNRLAERFHHVAERIVVVVIHVSDTAKLRFSGPITLFEYAEDGGLRYRRAED